MAFEDSPHRVAPIIQYFINPDTGRTVAACVSGFVDDVRPDDNRALPETPSTNPTF